MMPKPQKFHSVVLKLPTVTVKSPSRFCKVVNYSCDASTAMVNLSAPLKSIVGNLAKVKIILYMKVVTLT
jgi:hypothetical protein